MKKIVLGIGILIIFNIGIWGLVFKQISGFNILPVQAEGNILSDRQEIEEDNKESDDKHTTAQQEIVDAKETVEETKDINEDITSRKLTLSVAGDCVLGYYKGQDEWNRFDQVAAKEGYTYFFENVAKIFEEDDITLVNLEAPLTNAPIAVEKEYPIKGMPEYTQILKEGNVEVVNLANNHTMDCGDVGYLETQKVLEQADIGYSNNADIYIKEINDIHIGIIGAKGWSNSQGVKNDLAKWIKQTKEQADIVVINFHWGDEGTYYPNAIQRDLAHFVIDEGVDLVVGSHPHVVQGIEKYKGKEIVYSLGNFSFGANRNPSDKDTFIYQVTFEITDGDELITTSEIIPCSISSVKERNDYRPTPLEGDEKERVLKRLEEYSKGI